MQETTTDSHVETVFVGGADRLQLEEGGKTYLPGDTLRISQLRKATLQGLGLRFETRVVPDEPKDDEPKDPPKAAAPAADPKPAEKPPIAPAQHPGGKH